MSKFIIKGGIELNGSWRTQGMKNAATPIVAATLLTDKECIIHNIPRISDLHQMLSILEKLGSSISWDNEHTLRIQTKKIKTCELPYKLAKSMRSSVLLMGPMISRCDEFAFPEPGGCSIGNRPLDAHFKAMESFGCEINKRADGYYAIKSQKLQANRINLIEKSVTATENAMMAASRIDGKTIIKNVAQEPHIVCLGDFLMALGAQVKGHGTNEITIQGKSELNGAEFEVIPDMLEVGTIAVLGALSAGEIKISPVVPEHMQSVRKKLIEAGVSLEEKNNSWIIKNSKNRIKNFKIKTEPFPGFPTDLQAVFGVLATQAKGTSTIYDPMFENRLAYMEELSKMGAITTIKDVHTAIVKGPSNLSGRMLDSLDLRAGATLLIAGLMAQDETIINKAEIIDRGYEKIDERLRSIGADITRVD